MAGGGVGVGVQELRPVPRFHLAPPLSRPPWFGICISDDTSRTPEREPGQNQTLGIENRDTTPEM